MICTSVDTTGDIELTRARVIATMQEVEAISNIKNLNQEINSIEEASQCNIKRQ